MTDQLDRPSGNLAVLVVDDHEVVQWGFRLMLGSQSWVSRCIGATSGEEASRLARRYQPDVAVVDLYVGNEAGLDITRRIREEAAGTNVLLISGAGRVSPDTAQLAGASGFISKACAAADVARAVRIVGLGMTVFSDTEQSAARLSDREAEVLTLIARGSTNREIAAELHLSAHTVKGHTSKLYRKLDARNRAEAVQRAQNLGIG